MMCEVKYYALKRMRQFTACSFSLMRLRTSSRLCIWPVTISVRTLGKSVETSIVFLLRFICFSITNDFSCQDAKIRKCKLYLQIKLKLLDNCLTLLGESIVLCALITENTDKARKRYLKFSILFLIRSFASSIVYTLPAFISSSANNARASISSACLILTPNNTSNKWVSLSILEKSRMGI